MGIDHCMNNTSYVTIEGFTLALQETGSIHDSVNLPKIEFAYNVRGPKVVTLTHLSDCPGLETLTG